MATKNHELLELEREFWDALQAKDGQRAAGLTDDECIVVGAQGVAAIDPPTMEKMTVEGGWELNRYSFDEENAQVRFIDDNVAVVAYKVNETIVVDGQTLALDANDSSVWVRRNGEWRCALHTESLAGDPFGRDRRA